MPTKPKIVTLTNSSADVLNAIRNNASIYYREHVPIATADAESIRTIGATIMDYTALQNEFISSLVNRIGRVILTSRTYDNPWAMFKRGFLEFGETVEEIFANLAQPFTFDAEVAEKEVFKREIPDVKSAFHVMNYQKFYKATISRTQLKQAFLSEQGVLDLIAAIVDSMYTAANYDEFITMKYMLARHIIDGKLHPVTLGADYTESADAVKSAVSTIKGASNAMTFLSTDYNVAGVYKATPKNEQYLIVSSEFSAVMDVEVLAAAFNMNKAEFMGRVIMVDSFGSQDTARLGQLFAGDATYHEISTAEMSALNTIPAVLVDRDWFMIFDNLNQFDENYNGQGLYWNYFYHVWKTFSVSPFANNTVFLPNAPTVTSVKVNPSAVSAGVGQTVQLVATVETSGFAPQTVTWQTDSDYATVNASGIVNLLDGASGTITVTATSTYDVTKTASCEITVA